VLDKPPDLSSAKLVALVKRLLNLKKAGHAGTLDPFATGIMVVCANKATRLSRFFLGGDKTYQARLILGKTTDTQDFTGKVLEEKPVNVDRDLIFSVFSQFTGEQKQKPPSFSALKNEGTPLYKLARKGRLIQKPERTIHIHRLCVKRIDLPAVDFEVTCSSGTYVRTLCNDIGARLDCGGHLGRLRRTGASGFCMEETVKPEDLTEAKALGPVALTSFVNAHMIPMAPALRQMPEIKAEPAMLRRLTNGEPISNREIFTKNDFENGKPAKIVDFHGRLLAVMGPGRSGSTAQYLCNFSTDFSESI
jgi:tRNA pseudouridine55 synthase